MEARQNNNENQHLVTGDAFLLELKNITKTFPGVKALDSVSINVRPGEIHVLLGENGAGKSTLIKTIIGVEKADSGEMFWNGKAAKINSIKDAFELGIAVIYQELSNIPCLSVAENMYLSNEIPIMNIKHTVDKRMQVRRAREALQKVGCDIDPSVLMEKIGMGQKQLAEIAKAIDRNAKLIIMDEPTSSLGRKEIDNLLEIMLDLKKSGVSILFITHKLDEAKKIGDIVTVLKDGKKVDTMKMEDATEEHIIKMMVGRSLDEKFPKRSIELGEVVFEVKNFTSSKYKDVSIKLRRGELLGIFGLVGAGRTELARGIFGADKRSSGELFLEGKGINVKSPEDAISKGIVLATENRKEEGLILVHDVVENATLPSIKKFRGISKLLNQKNRLNKTEEYMKYLNLKPSYPHRLALNFSGGNQQKIVIEKWLISKSKIFIFDEPTKGVDVGAKIEIYHIMNDLLAKGNSIIMISSEMQEILGMSDRITVMYSGKITAELENDEKVSQEKIMIAATGGKLL